MHCEMHHFGGVEQGLRRHAAAKNAETAYFLPAFNDGRAQAGRSRAAGRSVAAAAAADNRHVVLKTVTHRFHNGAARAGIQLDCVLFQPEK